MEGLIPFFIVLFASIFSSTLFRRSHLPWVIALILAGIVIGPHVFNIFTPGPVIDFMSEVGLVFLLFMAGLESKLSSLRHYKKEIILLSFVNGFVPLLVGLGIGFAFGYDWVVAALIGIIFVNSSIAVVVPTLEATGLIRRFLGRSVLATSVLQDSASLLLLSIFLQISNPIAHVPLYLLYPLLIAVVVLLRYLVPKVREFFRSRLSGRDDIFQLELRSIFLVLFGVVIIFELLGLHAIIAAFFAGLILSDSISSKRLQTKLSVVSYGIFVPTFFVVVGTRLDFSVFMELGSTLMLISAVVLGSMVSKMVSGTLAGLMVGFNFNQASFFGATSVPQLSTTLAATFTAAGAGLIGQELVTALVVLTIVSTLIGPTLMNYFALSVLSEKDLEAGPRG
jgi:Kef-type K+ transport system membrane component KefB